MTLFLSPSLAVLLFSRLSGKYGLLAVWLLLTHSMFAQRSDCATPGADGNRAIVSSEIVNAYFAGNAWKLSGESLLLPLPAPDGVQLEPEPGMLLLVIQMQGADLVLPEDPTSPRYGSGAAETPMQGWDKSKGLRAGLYEYVTIRSVEKVGSNWLITLHNPLINTYIRADADRDHRAEGGINNLGQGQKRYQIVWVPQYQNLAIAHGATLKSTPWNGETGGVVAADVNGFLDVPAAAHATISAAGRGFRGGGARPASGWGKPAWVGPSGGDEPTASGGSRDEAYAPFGANRHGTKGEGCAGSPILVYQPLVAASPVLLATDGYPGGSFGQGAPGNAGGGGTDAHCYNQHNAGGGGGSHVGLGGRGGKTAYSARNTGGYPGGTVVPTPERLLMGGGGGAGSLAPDSPMLISGGSSGAPGGGIIALSARNLTIGEGASLTLDVSGLDAAQAIRGGGGGGGAGGSVLLLVKNADLKGECIANLAGGAGGNTESDTISSYIGPGGGGGGGIICTTVAIRIKAASADAGLAHSMLLPASAYGAWDGEPGTSQLPSLLSNVITGYECVPLDPAGTTLDNLRVYLVEGQPRLFWSLSTPDPAAVFEVQRSLNGSVFDALPLAGIETTDNQQFAYYDPLALPGGGAAKVFYRVRYQNTAGNFWLSPIAELNPDQAFRPFCTPAPNPASGSLVLQYDLGSGPAELSIFDLSGQIVHQQVLAPLQSSVGLDISGLQPGCYWLKALATSPEFSGTLFSRVVVY